MALLECCGESGPAGLETGMKLLSQCQGWASQDPDVSLASLELLGRVGSSSSSDSGSTTQVEELWSHIMKGCEGGKPSVRALSAKLQALVGRARGREGAQALLIGAKELVEAADAASTSTSIPSIITTADHTHVERGIVRVALALAQLCPNEAALVKEVATLAPLSGHTALDLLNAILLLQPSSGQDIMELADLLYHQQNKTTTTSPQSPAGTTANKTVTVPWVLPFYLACLQHDHPDLDSIKPTALKRAISLVASGDGAKAWLCQWHDGLAALLDAACELGDEEAMDALRQQAVLHVTDSPVIIHSLISCAAQEGRAGRAMSLFLRLDASAKTNRDYHAVLKAVAGLRLPPVGLGEREILESPLKFLTWLIDDMRTSGLIIGVETLNLALASLEQCCVWYGQSGEEGADVKCKACVHDAITLVNELDPEVRPNGETFLGLIGVAVRGHMGEQAQDLLRQLEAMEPGEEMMVKAYGMVVRLWAVYR